VTDRGRPFDWSEALTIHRIGAALTQQAADHLVHPDQDDVMLRVQVLDAIRRLQHVYDIRVKRDPFEQSKLPITTEEQPHGHPR